ncbi:MAG: hypothetical protein PHH73_00140 [Candidatus Rickettsiella isopodorum]|nr:hypothetical protein [Candidatus Rickettsiella isopodorum]
MSRKINGLIFFILLSLGLISKGFCWTETVARTDDAFKILQERTTAAYTISISSNNSSTHTIVGIYIQYASTGTACISSDLGATTDYFDISASAGDTLNEIISSITAISNGNWTATLCQGCYGGQASYVARIGTAAVDNEGYNAGLQNSDDTVGKGKRIILSTGTANAKTVYLNATQYIAYRKSPQPRKQNILGYVVTTSSWNGGNLAGGTMSVWEGSNSTACVTRVSPYFLISNEPGDTSYFPWNDPFNLVGTVNNAQEYIIHTPTYTISGDLYIIGKSKDK